MKKISSAFLLLMILCSGSYLSAQKFRLHPHPSSTGVNEYIEFTISCKSLPSSINPFTDVRISGVFTQPGGGLREVKGFCDSQDGSLYRLRFLPENPGPYSYEISISEGKTSKSFRGSFTGMKSSTDGIVEVSKDYPNHFCYRGQEKYYFWNSTTTYWLAGWKDQKIINQALERLASYEINRIRVAINGRSHGGDRWYEPNVVESEKFTLKLNPWLAKDPESLDEPGFDVSRMNIEHWVKLDSILLKARSLGIVVSLIFYVDGLDHACDPFKLKDMGNESEQLYYQYAISRFSAFPNIMWDIANEYHLFRTPEWAEKMGSFVSENDPWNHLISVHGSGSFPFRTSPWADVVMFQSWDECGGHDFITNARREQSETGMPKPIVNEEYGYEGHYSPWGCGPTASKLPPFGRSALNRSMLAWEICMAGGYQTTGETAEFGTGKGEDTGGGWINGRGNDKMKMLEYYRIMKHIFEQTRYYSLLPANHLTNYGNYCLAREGEEYLVYTKNQHCRIVLPDHSLFHVTMIDPETGLETDLGIINTHDDNGAWQYRSHLFKPAVFILRKQNGSTR